VWEHAANSLPSYVVAALALPQQPVGAGCDPDVLTACSLDLARCETPVPGLMPGGTPDCSCLERFEACIATSVRTARSRLHSLRDVARHASRPVLCVCYCAVMAARPIATVTTR